MGHRQVPACELWTKHRNERGIPIVNYPPNNAGANPNNEQRRDPPAQINVVMMEEHTQQHYQNQYTVTDQGTTEDFS